MENSWADHSNNMRAVADDLAEAASHLLSEIRKKLHIPLYIKIVCQSLEIM